jgi:hypothetical protein
MTDRAPAIAAFMYEIESHDPDAITCAVISRWPDVTQEEIRRGARIASELVRAEIAERRATTGLYIGLHDSRPL